LIFAQFSYHDKFTLNYHDRIYNCNYKSRVVNHVFKVDYVKSFSKKSSNPSFPSICIKALNEFHSAYIQVVRTDSDVSNLKFFIDSADKDIYPDIYPFYSLGDTLYDSPCWKYSLFRKPFRSWIAHTYSVNFDSKNKLIILYGGVKWGYKFKYKYSIYPSMIEPISICKYDLYKDLTSIKQVFTDYKITVFEGN
jgi:hypothetical protein